MRSEFHRIPLSPITCRNKKRKTGKPRCRPVVVCDASGKIRFRRFYAATRTSEPIIHAEAEDVRFETGIDAGQHVALILKPNIEVFCPGGPVRRQTDLD